MMQKGDQRIRVFISYSHAPGDEHKAKVLQLAQWLRNPGGVEAWIDQYVSFPPQGWPAWCVDQMEAADYVLVVCEETYKKRFDRKQESGIGLGVTWESQDIIDWLYEHAVSGQGKVIPIVFSGADMQNVPKKLSKYTTYNVGNEGGLLELLRYITSQPGIVPADLGPVLDLTKNKPLNRDSLPNFREHVIRSGADKQSEVVDLRRRTPSLFQKGVRVRVVKPGLEVVKVHAPGLEVPLLLMDGQTGVVVEVMPKYLVRWDAQLWIKSLLPPRGRLGYPTPLRLPVEEETMLTLQEFTSEISPYWLRVADE
ncbi:SEFIR domain-containing protein [Nonomuraea sp. NPDC048882]|uniref:SEFIR domain-containing protein n=1 Tax=Nonomuraea sp. NPDC048882 TaxID=3154347 RepID=UPI0033EE2F1B